MSDSGRRSSSKTFDENITTFLADEKNITLINEVNFANTMVEEKKNRKVAADIQKEKKTQVRLNFLIIIFIPVARCFFYLPCLPLLLFHRKDCSNFDGRNTCSAFFYPVKMKSIHFSPSTEYTHPTAKNV